MERIALWVTQQSCVLQISKNDITLSKLFQGPVFCGKEVKVEVPLRRVGQYF